MQRWTKDDENEMDLGAKRGEKGCEMKPVCMNHMPSSIFHRGWLVVYASRNGIKAPKWLQNEIVALQSRVDKK